ncbi:hypothetical protein [Flavobacterium foetidum]|uniref:hypothetical protein n=1 Tax=Flavobacterium foetidum TaxID=2026681 RepID=UPI001074F92C|nr:hypothetical protein [Flavobacterium foetidum]KAF2508092.1 hypothetical protein E0W73_20040 [Flavobacterium foetidum]
MTQKNNFSLLFTGILFLSILFLSCDTEYIDKVNTIPGDVVQVPGYTQIESFTIKDTKDNSISAALTEDNIVVTWSNHLVLPETIKPEIILGTEASISPASGTEVPFKDGTVYTVTSKAGTTKKYTLKIDFRQKEPTAWVGGAETLYKGLLQKKINSAIGGTTAIDNLWLSIKDSRVYFVSATDQKEYTSEIVFMGIEASPSIYTQYGVYYFLPENIPPGMYDLRIKNGAYTMQAVNEEGRFKISIEEPTYFSVERYGTPSEKQAGETIEIRGGLLNTLTSAEVYVSTASSVTYPLEIVSLTPYRAVLKIPAGTPAGTYNRIRFRNTLSSSLSVTAYTLTIK